MARHYRKRGRQNNDIIVSVAMVITLSGAALYFWLPAETARYFLATAGALLVALMLGAAYYYMETELRRKRRLRSLDIAAIDTMDGLEFEVYLAELLKHSGYTDVRLTTEYDLGVDLIASKDGERWGIQAKRYSKPVRAEAVRQVVTALKHYDCQRSMVITNSTFTRNARTLADSNSCVLVGRQELGDLVVRFQDVASDKTS